MSNASAIHKTKSYLHQCMKHWNNQNVGNLQPFWVQLWNYHLPKNHIVYKITIEILFYFFEVKYHLIDPLETKVFLGWFYLNYKIRPKRNCIDMTTINSKTTVWTSFTLNQLFPNDVLWPTFGSRGGNWWVPSPCGGRGALLWAATV